MSWQHLGTEGLGALVEHNDDLAAYLAETLRAAPDFELACEPELSVVCFRHLPDQAATNNADLDAYENALQRALELDGTAWVSVTTLRGRTYLRAGIVNYLSTRVEVDALIAALRRLSEGVLEELDRG
jgi:L-2,4-diaminobutyrate decarboxylase